VRRRRRERERAGYRLLSTFARVEPEAFFVQIGAGDGRYGDPLWPFVKGGAWRGVLVEPVPYVFERLRRNYAGNDRVALENVAVSDHDGRLTLFHVDQVGGADRARVPDHYHLLASTSRELLLRQTSIPELEDRIVSVEVPCLSPATLLARHSVDRLDVLVIDAEGLDCQILQNFDIEALRPRIIAYEDINSEPAESAACRGRLESLGYETMQEEFDTWAVDGAPDDEITRRWRAIRERGPAVSREDLERWFAAQGE